MRFVPINSVRAGMKTGKCLFGKNGQLLLNSGVVIQRSFIDKIKELGYNGIYVDDELSEGIEIDSVISDDLRHRTVLSIKETFARIEKSRSNSSFIELEDIAGLLDNIVDEIIGNTDILVNVIDLKIFDDYTFYHSVNVAVLSLIVGVSLGLNKSSLRNLGLAALLHDIGKVFIPKAVLNKPSRLSDDELELIRTHPYKGYQYLKDKPGIPARSCIGILQHHERYDFLGYPSAIGGNQISLYARIIAVTDVYDALTSRRPYRKAMSPSEALEYVMGGGGTHFDPEIAVSFTQKIAPFPVGTCVRLSNDAVGIVVENFKDFSLRPKLKIIEHNGIRVEPYFLDLSKDKSALDITVTGLADADD